MAILITKKRIILSCHDNCLIIQSHKLHLSGIGNDVIPHIKLSTDGVDDTR